MVLKIERNELKRAHTYTNTATHRHNSARRSYSCHIRIERRDDWKFERQNFLLPPALTYRMEDNGDYFHHN